MRYVADLHIHSPYSRATSKTSHLHGLAAWASIKGIDVVGTGDFTHPGWVNQLLENLEPTEPGFFRLKDIRSERFRDVVPPGLVPDISGIRFVLTAEISSIYKRGGRVRKIHNILFAPDLDSVRRINATLSGIGNLESDGRPILGLDSRNLLEILLEKAPEGFLVPAHIWTPWFSLFGSKSGFDDVEECFGDLTEHIFALETGLSSDPDMNRTISALDRYTLISNSDCHSPGKLGREANIFSTGFDFFSMREALRKPAGNNGDQRFAATIEFYPEEGKYHCDGHRKCRVCMEPHETREHEGICPACGRPVTVGVLYRVRQLADRDGPLYPEGSPAVHSLVPLPELLGELLQVGSASKKVLGAYVRLIQQFGSEFAILLDADPEELMHSSSLLAEAVHRVRNREVIRQPGYDGEFGVIRVFTENERKRFGGQRCLFASTETRKPKKRPKTVNKAPAAPRKKEALKKKELNPEQLQIVQSEARHIIVKAGPGTGKTHTLVQRLIRIAATGKGPCTVITFTNKAANELAERLGTILGDHASIHVSTMHGYCLKWLRMHKTGIRVAGPETRKWFLKSLRDQGRVENISELDTEITAYLQQAPGLSGRPPLSMEPYFSLLQAEGLVDIDAVVPEMATLLSEGNTFAETVCKETGTLFIDEFQDLNRSQYEMVRMLAGTLPVFAIGDPDQAIYGFRGSSPSWFYRFIEDMEPQQFSLFRNYRCTRTIVDAADSVIGNNYHPGPVVQNESCAGGLGRIFFYQADSPRGEAVFIGQQIEELIGGTTHREIDRLHNPAARGDVTLQDIAVLYRTSRQADMLASTLFDHGFPVQVVDVRQYYLNRPVRPLYLWSLLAAGLADSAHLMAVLEHEPGMDRSSLHEFEQHLPLSTVDIFMELAAQQDGISVSLKNKISKVLDLRTRVLQVSAENGVVAALRLLASRYKIADGEADLARFYRLAENFGQSLDAFAQHLLHQNDSVVYDERAEAITLMTLHASKGLEFKVVFIAGLEEGLLPLQLRPGNPGVAENHHYEEERRLFYVGLTRAEEILYLTRVRNRGERGKDGSMRPSRFLSEIPADLLTPLEKVASQRTPRQTIRQLTLF